MKGRHWARVLGVGYCFAAILIAWVWFEKTPLFWLNLFWDLAWTLVMWFFLFRLEAKAYFADA